MGAQLSLYSELYPPEIVSAMQNATLIMANGLANYESMTEYQVCRRLPI